MGGANWDDDNGNVGPPATPSISSITLETPSVRPEVDTEFEVLPISDVGCGGGMNGEFVGPPGGTTRNGAGDADEVVFKVLF